MYQKQLKQIEQVIAAGPFKDSWDSLADYQVPKWYTAAKFGIFSHFGPYTVPEFGHDWYVHGMYTKDDFISKHHIESYGPVSEFGYKYLVEKFKAENFDADKWLELIASSGAKYYVPVAEHHDGFQMYDSAISNWNSKLIGPGKDIISELQLAAEQHNVEFGLSTHRAEHYFFLSPGLEWETDVHDAEFGDLYWPTKPKSSFGDDPGLTALYLDDWMVRTIELIDKFKPRVLYFDFWIEHVAFKNHMKKILAYYYNTMLETYGDCGVVNYKHDGVAYGCAVRDIERGQFADIQRDYWQACTASAHGAWIYTTGNKYKSSTEVVRTLIDVISKNGNLLFNIGPRADGTFCEQEVQLLTEIGQWIEPNSEAIFGTHPWKIFGEGDTNVVSGDFCEEAGLKYDSSDIRFTSRANKIYAFVMNPTGVESVRIKSFGLEKSQLKKNNNIISVQTLGQDLVTSYERNDDYLLVNFKTKLSSQPIVIRLELE